MGEVRRTLEKPLYWSQRGQSQQFTLPYGTDVFSLQNQQLTVTGNRGLQVHISDVYMQNVTRTFELATLSLFLIQHKFTWWFWHFL